MPICPSHAPVSDFGAKKNCPSSEASAFFSSAPRRFLKCGKSNPRAFVCKRMGGRSTELQVYSMTGGDQEPLTIRNLKVAAL